MIIKAYAKINLTLDITGVRSDGFHELRSVMVPVTLCDDVVIECADTFSFDCNIKSICGDNNLCVRAAKAFFERAGLPDNVSIFLDKKVPFPAGLGGGSSDAAAVLRGLNELFGNPLEEAELFEISAKLGSDIPFCLLGSPALCEGRGELLTPISLNNELDVVIAIGEGRLPTADVYRSYDSASLEVKNDTDAFLSAVDKNDFSGTVSALGNAFEPVTDLLCPETKTMRELMLSFGALSSHLSGSGPSVYGIFDSRDSAEQAAERMRAEGYSAFVCKTKI